MRRLLLAAGRARAAGASARARLAKFERVLPPGRLKAAGRQYSPQGAHRLLWLLRRRPLRWPLLRRLAGGTAAGGRCTRAFPRGRRRAARAQLCWYTARVVTQPRRIGGAAREARAISYF